MVKEFEAWWLEGVYPLRRIDRFEDSGCSEELAQEIWEASRAAIEVDLPKVTEFAPYDKVAYVVDRCARMIEAQGFKVKA
jgi:hypothetical protein